MIACRVFRLLLHKCVIAVVAIRCFFNSNYDFQEQGKETRFVQVLVLGFVFLKIFTLALELEEKILSRAWIDELPVLKSDS